MARVEKSIDVNVPVQTAYNQWTQFEDFPNFMEGVDEVQQLDDTHLHWRVKVGGKEKEFDAEITEQVPDQVIAWRSVDGTQNAGTVRFYPAQDGTQITFIMEYDPEGFVENVSDIVGVTSRRVEGDLQRFKEFVESRGVETGQWRGEVRQGQTTGKQSKSSRKSGASAQMQAEQSSSAQQMGSASSSNISQQQGGMRGGGQSQGSNVRSQSSGGQTLQRAGTNLASRSSGVFGGWEDPFLSVRRMADEMERMFEDVFGSSLRPASRQRSSSAAASIWTPPVEVSQRGDSLVVFADLPGLRKEDVQVEIQDGMLTIQGERREEVDEGQGGFRRSERRYGQFFRAIQLPEGVNPDDAQATIRDGVLEVSIPVSQETQRGRRLEIRDEQQESASKW